MGYILILLAVAMTLVLWHNKMKSKKTAAIEVLVTERIEKMYHAVKLEPCFNPCEPAKWVSEKLYLVEELSRLPLESCDRISECQCKFEHFDDRRHNEDRRSGSTILQNIFDGINNRKHKKRGRRSKD